MRSSPIKLLILLASVFPAVVFAEVLPCPELASAVQVGACPGEEELRLTFRGYCSDNQRMYDKEQLCLDYGIYRAAKNNSLWESADGRYAGYLSCDMTAQSRRDAKVVEVKLGKQGTMNLVACVYSNDARLVHRTKAACIAEPGDCAGNPAQCAARCE